MFSELLLLATQASMCQAPYIQQYVAQEVREFGDGIINTAAETIKNGQGAYPWEIIKRYGNNVYYLYQNCFRTKHYTKIYRYFEGLNSRSGGITYRYINPTDCRSVMYFNIDSILAELPYRIERAGQIHRGKSSSVSDLIEYYQIVLDLQKEYLDVQQSMLDFCAYMQSFEYLSGSM